ncbi:MAG: carbonic anhydrase [Pyrinomonadaceae bacterium]|nr:carbonic anhydrase [Pyrinomonadaceae bacterium]
MSVPTKELQEKTTPRMALQMLREGNYRFINNLKTNRNLMQQVSELSNYQYPLVVILSCIDSRTATQLVFDQGLGTIISVRVAGNVIGEDVLGSIEFGCKFAGAKLIVVMGHTKCGAIRRACDDEKVGHLTKLLSKIKPAIEMESTTEENRTSRNFEFVDKVAEINVRQSLNTIITESDVLREMIEKGEVGIIGAIYETTKGNINFFENSYMCGETKPLPKLETTKTA